MKKYLSIFSITLQEYFVYRLNMLMWRVRQIFVFLLPYFLWRAVLAGGGNIYGYDFASIITYLFGTTILRSLVMGSRTVDLGWMINSGMLTIPLMRPLNMFRFLLTRDAADKLFNLSFMFIEIPLIFLIFNPPVFLQTNPYMILLTSISVILAILIYFYINIIFGSLGFWTRDVWASRFLLMVILEFATGAMFPLDMLSNFWQKVLLWTPFPYLLFIPLRIYLGSNETVIYLLGQAIWVILLYLFARYVWQRGLLRYEAEGR
ncbi:MAG: ABC-2 family transporter protein [Candidatus Microgenomates bacterium]